LIGTRPTPTAVWSPIEPFGASSSSWFVRMSWLEPSASMSPCSACTSVRPIGFSIRSERMTSQSVPEAWSLSIVTSVGMKERTISKWKVWPSETSVTRKVKAPFGTSLTLTWISSELAGFTTSISWTSMSWLDSLRIET
jgi:hypothetical protein